jgi:FkbM family methyltransferase
MYSKIKAYTKKILSYLRLKSASEKKVVSIYKKLLGRIPSEDELLHWEVMKVNPKVINRILTQSYEYQQKLLSEELVLVNLPRFSIYAMKSDIGIGNSIIELKQYEPHVTNILTKLLDTESVFLDLGSNIGYFSLLAASIVGSSGKVISFEPNMQNLQLLYLSTLENKFNNIHIYPFAASNTQQILKITSFGSNGFLDTPSYNQINGQFTQSMIIDKILHNEDRINVVKMDIEGYEPLALNGMQELISIHRPTIITEFSPWHIEHRSKVKPRDYLQEILNFGYSLSIIEQSGCARLISSIESLMIEWQSLKNDKHHFDLIAQPLENSPNGELKSSFVSINNSVIALDNYKDISIYQTPIGDYFLPATICTDIVINTMKEGKIFEPEIIEVAKEYISSDSTVLDIGANFGQMTLIFSEFAGKKGKVFSFEADDFIFSILERNIAIKNTQNIIPICKAVYNTDNQKMFFPIPDFTRFASYGSYGLSPQAKEGRTVSTITIDSLNITDPISFIKVDIQGSDLFALQGAVETINRFRMPIIFEYEDQFQEEFNTSWQDYVDFIDRINYKIDRVVNGINYLIVPKD